MDSIRLRIEEKKSNEIPKRKHALYDKYKKMEIGKIIPKP
jgi:hypothetical protein